MKTKISLIIATLILIVPILCYALLKTPATNSASAKSLNKPEMIEFYTPLCSECQKLQKTLDKVEPKYNHQITFTKINAALLDDKNLEIIKKYNIRVVPTSIFLDKKGNMMLRVEGAMSETTLTKNLKELLK